MTSLIVAVRLSECRRRHNDLLAAGVDDVLYFELLRDVAAGAWVYESLGKLSGPRKLTKQ